MKHTRKATWFLSGMLCAALLANTVAPAAAALVAKTLQVYTGIEVFVDDVKIDAGDTHGNPDAFAYNGTTYVAVAAISKSLGEKVYWDGNEKKVYIGEHDTGSHDFLSTCTPYKGTYQLMDSSKVSERDYLVVAGKQYEKGIYISNAMYNLGGMYDTLTFTVAYPDNGSYMYHQGDRLSLWFSLLDSNNNVIDTYDFDISEHMLPTEHTVDLKGATYMQIGGYKCGYFLLTDMKIS